MDLELLGLRDEGRDGLQPAHVGAVAELSLAIGSNELAVLRLLEPVLLLLLIALGMGGILTGSETLQQHAPVLLSSIHPLFPNAHRIDLWRPDLLSRLPSILMLLAMSATYFGAGHMVMSRRDA